MRNEDRQLLIGSPIVVTFVLGSLLVLCVAIVGWFILPRFNSGAKNVVLEGILTREAPTCPENRQAQISISVVLISVLYTPTPYALSGLQQLGPQKQPSKFEGKRLKVSAFTTRDVSTICLQGELRQIPTVKVIDVEVLEP